MSSSAPPSSHIRVFVRVRPLNARELAGAPGAACLTAHPAHGRVELHAKPESKSFSFSGVADESAQQSAVFEQVGKPITDACMAGYNGTIFAYGQTGSGKTFTIQGATSPSPSSSLDQRGLMPRVFEYLMACISRETSRAGSKVTYDVRCSMIEIYNERIFDLLDPSSSSATAASLQLREDQVRGVFVEGVTSERVQTAAECQSLMDRGASARRVGETALNRESSRSHCVLILDVTSTSVSPSGRSVEKRARFSMIDLAGSERAKATGAEGKRMDEAKSINRSLSALGNVVRELQKAAMARGGANEREVHVPYRDSKLTFLLRDSLGGNSLTFLVACVSSAGSAFFESMSTLKFATMASSVRNNARVNEREEAGLEAMKEEMRLLREALARAQAVQSMGARRMSMMMPSHGPRDSFAGAGGLLTPARLRNPAGIMAASSASSPSTIAEEEGPSASSPSAPLVVADPFDDQTHSLFLASQAREAAWKNEVALLKEQVRLLEERQRLDALRLRLRTSSASSVSAAGESEDEEVASLRQEVSLLRQAATLPPSLLDAHRKIAVLSDALSAAGVAAPSAPKAAPELGRHERAFDLQESFLRAQEDLDLAREALLGLQGEFDLFRSSSAPASDLAQLQASLDAERSLVTHLESQLDHLSLSLGAKEREREEESLLSRGAIVHAQAERDALKAQVVALEQAHSAELASLRGAEQSAASLLAAQESGWKTKHDALSTLASSRGEELFGLRQDLALTQSKLTHATEDLSLVRSKLAEAEKTHLEGNLAAQQANAEAASARASVEALLEQSLADLGSTRVALLESQTSLLSTRASLDASSTRADSLEFKLDSLQEDHDTLTSEFGFVQGELEASRAEGGKIAQDLAAARGEVKELRAECDSLRAQVDDARAALALAMSSRTSTEEYLHLAGRLEESQGEAQGLREELAASRGELDASHARAARGESKATTLETQVTSLDQGVADLRQALAQSTSRADGLAAERERLALALDSRSAELDQERTAHSAVGAQLVAVQGALESQASKLVALRGEVDDLLRARGDLEGQARALSGELEQTAARLAVTRKELAASAASVASGAATIESLRTQLASTEALVAELRRTQGEMEVALAQLAATTGERGAEESRLHAALAQSLADNAVLAGVAEKRAVELVQARRTLESMQGMLDALGAHKLRREADLAQAKSALTAAVATVEPLRAERDVLIARVAALESKVASLQSEALRRENELSSLRADGAIAVDLQAEVLALQERWNSGLQERTEWLREIESARSGEISALDELAAIKAQHAHAVEAASVAQEKLVGVETVRRALEEQNAQLIGHQNQRQKIQLHQNIKKENDTLRQDKEKLEREIKRFRKLHASTHGTGSAVGAALEKELQEADDHIRQGEAAQAQLKIVMDKIHLLAAKIKPQASALGDITNTADKASASAAAASSKDVAFADAPSSVPSCLTALSSFASTFVSLTTQLDAARREATALRSSQKLQQLKNRIDAQHQNAEARGDVEQEN